MGPPFVLKTKFFALFSVLKLQTVRRSPPTVSCAHTLRSARGQLAKLLVLRAVALVYLVLFEKLQVAFPK